jgi:palmitoyltransferase
MTFALSFAITSINDRCITRKDISTPQNPTDPPTYPEEPDSALIVHNYASLLKDLPRINDVVAIARNVLTIGEQAQYLAATSTMDKHVLSLVYVCVKVAARGFEMQGGTKEDEKKWQLVVNDCTFPLACV